MDIQRPQSVQPIPSDAKLVFHGEIFDVYQWQQEGYDGNMRTFEKLKRPDTACIIPITTEGKILIAHEQQPGRQPFLSLPGGRLEPNEDALHGAKRELLEETGYASTKWVIFDAVQPNHKVDWAVYTFLAKDCVKQTEQHLDGAERIKLQETSFEEFIDIVLTDGFDDPGLQIRVLKAKLDPIKMEELRQLFLG